MIEVEINANCPHCGKSLRVYSRSSPQKEPEKCKADDVLFEFGKEIAKHSKDKDFFFKDLFGWIDECSRSKKAKEYIKEYFGRLAFQIKMAKDPKELAKISKKLEKMKVRVSEEVLEEFEKNKKQALDVIRKRSKGGFNGKKERMPKKSKKMQSNLL